MHSSFRTVGVICLLIGLLVPTKAQAQTGSFLDHEVTWVSPDTVIYPLDGKPNFVVRVVNQGSEPSPDRFSFEFTSPDYPNPGGGFATFPNGGYIKLAPAETTWVLRKVFLNGTSGFNSMWIGALMVGRNSRLPNA